jgi:hypothetical protein
MHQEESTIPIRRFSSPSFEALKSGLFEFISATGGISQYKKTGRAKIALPV